MVSADLCRKLLALWIAARCGRQRNLRTFAVGPLCQQLRIQLTLLCARCFADVHFRIEVPEEALHVIKVSMVMPGYKDLKP